MPVDAIRKRFIGCSRLDGLSCERATEDAPAATPGAFADAISNTDTCRASGRSTRRRNCPLGAACGGTIDSIAAIASEFYLIPTGDIGNQINSRIPFPITPAARKTYGQPAHEDECETPTA